MRRTVNLKSLFSTRYLKQHEPFNSRTFCYNSRPTPQLPLFFHVFQITPSYISIHKQQDHLRSKDFCYNSNMTCPTTISPCIWNQTPNIFSNNFNPTPFDKTFRSIHSSNFSLVFQNIAFYLYFKSYFLYSKPHSQKVSSGSYYKHRNLYWRSDCDCQRQVLQNVHAIVYDWIISINKKIYNRKPHLTIIFTH